MIKKLAALAATALLSMNATAGYVQYELSGAVSGHFIQHDTDKSIAYYELTVVDGDNTARFFPSGEFDNITAASTFFAGAGPTNFNVYDNLTDFYFSTLDLKFAANGLGGYTYGGHYIQNPIPDLPDSADPVLLNKTYYGSVSLGVVRPEVAANLDFYLQETGGYPDGLRRIVPLFVDVPEPTSIALFALGAAGLAGTSRRRKTPT